MIQPGPRGFVLSRPLHILAVGLLLPLGVFALPGYAQNDGNESSRPEQNAAPLSSTAENVYAQAKPRLFQIRTLLSSAGRQSSLGSAFMVSADGLAITNYHVVSQYALEPNLYRMEFAAPDGTKGNARLLAIDVTNDLAVVQLEKPASADQAAAPTRSYFQFNPRALDGTLPKGERLYSMGNPLDLGFTIVEGTYNSLVDKSYQERIHFSGAINAGMSGGPTVSLDGRIVGINVAKQIGGELVSFLVPAKFGAALLERARNVQKISPTIAATGAGTANANNANTGALNIGTRTREEIGRQLTTWQADHYKELNTQGFRPLQFGRYRAPEAAAPWFTCWARTNDEQVPKPRALLNTMQCSTKTWLYISNSLSIGSIEISHSHAEARDLNSIQFAQFLSGQWSLPWSGSGGKKHVTNSQCVEEFIKSTASTGISNGVNSGANNGTRPAMRVVWCAKALRDYAGLFNVSLMAVTQDSAKEALVSRMAMSGVSYENALLVGKRFLDTIEIAPSTSVLAAQSVNSTSEVRK
jgi:serine protease Do